ncbi:MAG: hypothetical protein CL897_01005 [Dehalococcoidia bacterium]|nr:hypothetical protein [Dehalococcoidia bacterium]HCV00657.1 hypothetical protein [Dehalococcoidia bacterium]|tara:strand:+ start:203 stop:421 length:219 start_codon:yes stop_codon:yes gene_type:complete
MIDALLPLYSPTSLGVIFVMLWIATSVILTIPAFATRGTPQMIWFGAAGFVLTVEAAVLIALAVLNSQGKIF